MKKEKVRVKHKKSLREQLWEQKYLFLLLLPSLVWVILICYAPMTGLYMSFINYTPQGNGYFTDMANSQFVGLDWFKYFFSTDFTKIMRNTLATSLLTLVFSFPLPIILAICLNEVRNQKAKKFVQTASYIPYFISWVIVGVMAFNIFSSDYGFMNRLITVFGGERISFYTNPKVWPFILTFFNVWKGIGYGSVMYLAAIMGIDTSIYEAAAIDGANVFQRIFKVTIPMIMPTTIILLLLSVGGIFKGNFDMFYNLVGSNGLLYNYTDVIDTLTFRALISSNDFGMSAAIGLFQSVLCFVTILIVNRLVGLYDKDYTLF